MVGLERERRKGPRRRPRAAGVRSFSIVALLGALAQAVAVAGLVPVGALVVGAMAALAYARSHSRDPGLTTELALIATCLVGVLAMRHAAARRGLRHAAGRAAGSARNCCTASPHWLREQSCDGLMLAALALVILDR